MPSAEMTFQIGGRALVEVTVLLFAVQMILEKSLEDGADMTDTVHLRRGVNQDVVQVDIYPPPQHVSDDIVQEAVKDRWAVTQTKGHNLVLPVAGGKAKCSLPFSTFPYTVRLYVFRRSRRV